VSPKSEIGKPMPQGFGILIFSSFYDLRLSAFICGHQKR
jgi:hypothetical protein